MCLTGFTPRGTIILVIGMTLVGALTTSGWALDGLEAEPPSEGLGSVHTIRPGPKLYQVELLLFVREPLGLTLGDIPIDHHHPVDVWIPIIMQDFMDPGR